MVHFHPGRNNAAISEKNPPYSAPMTADSYKFWNPAKQHVPNWLEHGQDFQRTVVVSNGENFWPRLLAQIRTTLWKLRCRPSRPLALGVATSSWRMPDSFSVCSVVSLNATQRNGNTPRSYYPNCIPKKRCALLRPPSNRYKPALITVAESPRFSPGFQTPTPPGSPWWIH